MHASVLAWLRQLRPALLGQSPSCSPPAHPALQAARASDGHDARERDALRASFGRFATGVTVVTAADDAGGRVGVTVNSFTSVSLDPPLVIWCLALRAGTLPVFRAARHHAMHVLAAHQQALASCFASPREDRFASVEVRNGPDGTPLLVGALAHFVCRNPDARMVGDHVMFVGEVICHRQTAGDALVFHSGRFATILDAAQDSAAAALRLRDSCAFRQSTACAF
jgi:unspecific monooxygenase